jgi:hypothetical protein
MRLSFILDVSKFPDQRLDSDEISRGSQIDGTLMPLGMTL